MSWHARLGLCSGAVLFGTAGVVAGDGGATRWAWLFLGLAVLCLAIAYYG